MLSQQPNFLNQYPNLKLLFGPNGPAVNAVRLGSHGLHCIGRHILYQVGLLFKPCHHLYNCYCYNNAMSVCVKSDKLADRLY